MKEEIEKILDIRNHPELLPCIEPILNLFISTIDSAEDEIVRCLINAKDTPRWGCQYVAKDILSIIKQKVGE
jgi:hypothetical protein